MKGAPKWCMNGRVHNSEGTSLLLVVLAPHPTSGTENSVCNYSMAISYTTFFSSRYGTHTRRYINDDELMRSFMLPIKKYVPSWSAFWIIASTSFFVGLWPKELITSLNSSAVILPLPSLSNSRNAFLKSRWKIIYSHISQNYTCERKGRRFGISDHYDLFSRKFAPLVNQTGLAYEQKYKICENIWIGLPSICSSVNLLEALSKMNEKRIWLAQNDDKKLMRNNTWIRDV